jgi:hypothetical protein
LTDARQGHNQKAWLNKKHTITIIATHEKDPSTDLLFVDHNHIHRNNWQWIQPRSQLVWQQGSAEGYLAGHVGFHVDNKEGAGSMQFGSLREPVLLDYLHPTYSCDVSANAGAYVVKNGPAYTIKWDTTSTAWKNATWAKDILTFSYWIEKDGKVGDQQLWQTAVVFNDTKTHNSWNVLPRGPGNSGAFSSNIDAKQLFTFNVNPGNFPPPDDRSSIDDGIKTVFPYQMAFQFDQLAIDITGGAMLCTKYAQQGDVYALQGKNQNVHAVGAYSLISEKGEQFGKVVTHGQKLFVAENAVPKSGVSGDRLWWDGLSPSEMKQTGLPTSGFVEFSSGGHVIKHSSFGARGIRQLATSTVTTQSSLQLQDLLNMNPYEFDEQGNMTDKVQQNSMEDFYKILQYYMPSDYLHNFIAQNPPDISDLRDIAEDDKTKNSEWYANLAVPYLVQALAQNKTDTVSKLNARRAQAVLKESTSTSDVYKDQAAKLYSYEWQKKFPLMTQFLDDQRNNAASHNPAIDQDAAQWIDEIKKDLDKATDPDEKKQLQEMINIAKNARDAGEQGKYWAYIFFRYLTSPSYLTMLRMQMMDGNTSQTVSQDIQRYSAVLSILDPSSYFAELFVQVIGIYQLTSLLPSILDVSGNLEDFTFFMQKILEAFIDKYVNSQDPQMQKEAKKVAEELKVHSLQDYLNIFNSVAGVLGNSGWQNLAQMFESKAVGMFGSAASYVANMLSLSAVSFGIYFLASGTINWNELTAVQQADFIASCVKGLVLLVRRGISAVVAYQAGDGLWEAFKVLFGKEISASQDAIGSAFGRWIARNSSTPKPTDLDILFGAVDHEAEFKATYPRLAKAVGRNLEEFMATRFAAAMAIVGIVLSAISLKNSSTPLETAMNRLFLASATLDLVAALAGWLISLEIKSIGALSIATIASLASGLAIAAAIAGIIIMLVMMFTHKNPPDPVEEFTNSEAVKNAGLFMQYSAAIDDFQVITDDKKKPRDLGVSIEPEGSSYYLNCTSDGSLQLGALTHGYDSVLSVATDAQGHSIFLTEIWDANSKSSIVALTLDDSKSVKMASKISSKDKAAQQQWIATCMGDVRKDEKGHLTAACFTIHNVFGGEDYYLNGSGRTISVSKNQQKWMLSMQPMKPEMLSFKNISLSTLDKDRKFYPFLLQVGSVSGEMWSVEPALPDWLSLNIETGIISQKSGVAPPVYSQTNYTITVTNNYGSANAEFYIKVEKKTY